MNHLIDVFGFKSYVEIGVYATNVNFDFIKAEEKYGVDPNTLGQGEATHKMTSDQFFAQNTKTFDLIFVDGLHHDDQVERDIRNSIACLNPGGIILVHDCNPLQEDHQKIPAVVSFWCGTVWKAWTKLLQELPPEYEMFVVNFDTGMGVIRKTGKGKKLSPVPPEQLTYSNLEANRQEWLNIVSLDDFLKWVSPPIEEEKNITVSTPAAEMTLTAKENPTAEFVPKRRPRR